MQIINNSKATNVESAVKSIGDFNNVYLILGGKAKDKNFRKFINYKKQIKKIYLIGESADLIFKQLKNYFNLKKFNSLEEALKNLFKESRKNNKKFTLLFSPACTSFDHYENFEKRGKHFKKIISKII